MADDNSNRDKYPKWLQPDVNVGPVLVRNEDEEKQAKADFAKNQKTGQKIQDQDAG